MFEVHPLTTGTPYEPSCAASRSEGPGALADGYDESELRLSGSAATYSGSVGGVPTVADEPIEYATRLIVRRPTDPEAFSGRVLIEPLNTSSGPDRDVLWAMLAPLLQGHGDAWIGVTGRAEAIPRLVEHDAGRYGTLDLPANDCVWDVLAAVAERVRHGGGERLLGGWPVERVYLGGFSQSATEVGTFAVGFHRDGPDGPLFDGYFPAARSASFSALRSGTGRSFEFGSIGPVGVPVIEVQTETDVDGFAAEVTDEFTYVSPGSATVRRDDSDTEADRYRLFELAGAPHTTNGARCDGTPSTYPTAAFVRGAYDLLLRWAEHGHRPPRAARIELAVLDDVSRAATDSVGNAIGGVRSPYVDVPIARFAAHASPGPRCLLCGTESPLHPDELQARYGSLAAYLDAFEVALDQTIRAGHLVAADRADLLSAERARAAAAFEGAS